ncbi:MAG: DsbA family protein [Pseudomonadota bacterium]
MTLLTTRRAAIGGALGLAAAAVTGVATPLRAQEDELAAKGYALGDIIKGDPDAPVTIIEYASLTCPHCASFHLNSYPQIEADYIETGKAKLILREIYFDKFGLWSAAIARCGGEAAYYPILDMFLSRQRQWYSNHVGAYNQTKNDRPIIDEMKKIGRLAGLSNERMDSCLGDQDYFERLVEDFRTTSTEDGVRSTPTFFINGEQVVGAVSASTLAEVIERNL